MGSKNISVRARSGASPEVILALLTDGASWPSWSGHDSFELVEAAPDGAPGGREGVGAVRIFNKGKVASKERVVEYVPGKRFSYELITGLPLDNYRADVDLTPIAAGGTEIHWHSTFDPKRPGTGWIYAAALRQFIGRATKSLAAQAAAPPASASSQ